MTQRRSTILEVALDLFARQGYDSTSTSKIAMAAGVSEGLIFRHFGNKKGLLDAIMQSGKSQIGVQLDEIRSIDDPAALIQAVLSIPFEVPASQYPFWRLFFALKWQEPTLHPSILGSLDEQLESAFQSLGYASPESEVALVHALIDGAVSSLLLKSNIQAEQLQAAMLRKYHLSL